MDNRMDENALALEQFGVGQPVLRVEDPTLLKGEGRYTDDVNVAGQAHAYVVRSRYAHGTIRKVDVAAARKMPGVLGAYAAADLAAAGVNPIKCGMMVQGRDGKPWLTPVRPVLAAEKVRFSGEAVAMVVAETPAQAKDAAEAVEVEIDPLPAAPSAAAALASGAPQVHDSVPGNVAVDYHWGDSAKVADAFAKAAHVTKLSLVSNRIVINPMEPRSALGQYDAGSRQIHADGLQPGRLRHEGRHGHHSRHDARQDARADAQCRRLFRHEEPGLPRERAGAVRGQGARPAGQMDRRALGQLRLRSSRPRSRDDDRRRVRQGRQHPRRAPDRHRQCRRLSDRAAALHRQRGEERRQRLSHAAARSEQQGRLHQFDAGRRLSRRRTPRRQLLYGAAARHRGGRDGHRQARAAAPQSHPAERDPLQGAVGHELRQRRFPRACSITRSNPPTGRASSSAKRRAARAARSAAAASAPISKSPRRKARRWAASASIRMAASPSSPARSITARAITRPLLRYW